MITSKHYTDPERGCAVIERDGLVLNEHALHDLFLALEGVLRVADRKTDEFDAARAALSKANGKHRSRPLDENVALREMAKHAHRALNAASTALATVEDDIPGDETTEDLARRCGEIACSLFSLLRGNEVDRYESAPFASTPLLAAPC